MGKEKKERADILLLKQSLCDNIESAKRLIMAGKVRIGNDRVIQKPSEIIPINTKLILKGINQQI